MVGHSPVSIVDRVLLVAGFDVDVLGVFVVGSVLLVLGALFDAVVAVVDADPVGK